MNTNEQKVSRLFAVIAVFFCSMLFSNQIFAQRTTDKLDRGLIAMKVSNGVYINWRINAEEYYDVEYNVYRDGVKLNGTPLKVSNYTDATGTVNNKYTVSAVVRGVEQAQCAAASVWASSYKEIKLTHEGIKSTLVPNDACCADVDGDGEIDILMKFDNWTEISQNFPRNGGKVDGVDTHEYSIFECLKQDGTRLWWVNCGPNMGDFQNNEQNIVGYDWNMDGKAEVLMRLEEGSTIHMADGSTYTIGANGKNGTTWTNYRAENGGGANWFMCVGKEFLVYCDGETGKVLDIIDYPLARLESGETYLSAWGKDDGGHRASKFFFGAPYLDGKHPSIFLARGIYTQIKMCAFDVNTTTNKLVKRWDWRQTNGGYWMWQGFHNFGVADVDEDGRDEIVYGSMVVDDNGKGLSTTGFGHGDAQHCSDFNPYTKGLEIYTCNEDQPGNNYRDATTSKVYHRFNSGNDDGRAMCGNFSDTYPGSIGCSAREGAISTVTYNSVSGMTTEGINTNFRIYWDGDLCSETFNYINGKNTEGCVAKYGSWSPIYTCVGSMTNNDTKGTPCYQGDILGDWREEIIMRTANNNIRIYSTPTKTTYRIPSLWADHQYRNAMVWQMCGYNQPPHISYFLGKLEGITMAPPPLTMTGRTEIANGAVLDASYNDKHAILCENADTKISLADGAKPYIFTVNVPSWVQGTAGTNYTAKDATIKYNYYTCEVTGGYLDGDARLVKQGDGILKLPKADFKHTGATNIWAGTLDFDGTLKNSSLWLNRFTRLNTNGGEFRSISTNYASTVYPGGENSMGSVTVDSLNLGFGSRIVVDIYSEGFASDKINAKYLKIEKKTGIWATAGPKYIAPIIEIVPHLSDGEEKVAPGKYVLGKIDEISGSVSNIVLEGIATCKRTLSVEDGNLVLEVSDLRDASTIEWTGNVSNIWDLAETKNFNVEKEATTFVSEDNVIFSDDAKTKTVSIKGEITPSSVEFNGSSNYTISGSGAIIGSAKFINSGTGTVTMSGKNSYTGGNYLKGGETKVSLLSNQYSEVGNLGGMTTNASLFTMENGAILTTTAAVEQGSPMKMVGTEGGVINNSADFVMDGVFSGTQLTKKGSGWLKSTVNHSLSTLVVAGGTVDGYNRFASKIIMRGTSAVTGNAFLNTPIQVDSAAKASLTTINRATTNLALTGKGQITVYCATEKGSNYYATRTPIQLNLKNFEGTLVPEATYAADGRFTFDTSNGGEKWTLNIPASRYVQNTGKTLRIGTVIGKGELGGGCAFSNGVSVAANTWQVGNDKDFTFDGIVTSGDKFTKMGSGKMISTGVWTTTGEVAVNAGTLHIKSGAAVGTGRLTIGTDGYVLAVTKVSSNKSVNPLTNSSYTVNGTLHIGTSFEAVSGYLDFSAKAVTFGAKSRLIVGLRKSIVNNPNNTYITNVSTLKFTDGATIAPFLYSLYVPTTDAATPDKFVLWTQVTTANVGNVNLELPELPAYNYWDTSEIKDGILYVRCNEELYNAIEGISADDVVDVDVTNMSGMVVDHFTCPMGSVKASFAKLNRKGIYVLRIVNEEGKRTSLKVSK